MSLRTVLATGLAVCALAPACGGSDGGGTGATRPSSTAEISILEPQAGAVITGETMTVRIGLEGGEIVDETSRDLTPDRGHVHVKVDGKVLTQTYGLTQDIQTPEPGRHLLEAEFVALDHGPFAPRVIASLPFEVEG
jgi:hypothetical protein